MSVLPHDMSTDGGSSAGTELEVLRPRHRCTVDGIDHCTLGGSSQSQGRIAQQGILQLIGRAVSTGLYQLVLGTSHRLADGNHTAFLLTQHMLGEGLVHQPVITLEHRTRGTKESHRPTLLVEHGCLADILLLSVEGHDVAGACHPQRQSGRGVLEVGQPQHVFVRDGIGSAVTRVVHDQGSLLHLLPDEPRHIRIAVARRGRLAGIGIPHHTLHLVGGVLLLHQTCCSIGIIHVGILVTVVAHKTEHVLPSSGIGVEHIVLYLVYHYGSLVGSAR